MLRLDVETAGEMTAFRCMCQLVDTAPFLGDDTHSVAGCSNKDGANVKRKTQDPLMNSKNGPTQMNTNRHTQHRHVNNRIFSYKRRSVTHEETTAKYEYKVLLHLDKTGQKQCKQHEARHTPP